MHVQTVNTRLSLSPPIESLGRKLAMLEFVCGCSGISMSSKARFCSMLSMQLVSKKYPIICTCTEASLCEVKLFNLAEQNCHSSQPDIPKNLIANVILRVPSHLWQTSQDKLYSHVQYTVTHRWEFYTCICTDEQTCDYNYKCTQ